VLRLTTLPIPNAEGTMTTRSLTPAEAIEITREHFRASDCVSHIGYEETNRLVELRLGGVMERGDRHLPKPKNGDRYITVKLARNRGKAIEDFDFMLTTYEK